MRLPKSATIAREKITQYLLVRQSRSDKSAFLELAGFGLANPDALIEALVAVRDENDAQLVDENKFGRYFEVPGVLSGPSGMRLRVRTIWMTEHLSGATKFITLIPVEVLTK
ncbi:MAG TPA: hypothetical protein VHC86_09730 [Opitutaceae bacterium]|nr:hypothetical protein [Opitutaceae bacterium]